MFFQIKTFEMTANTGRTLAENFSKSSLITQQPGFVNREVGLKESASQDEVIILIIWESEEYFKQWVKSDAHLSGHKNRPKNENILKSSTAFYEKV